MNPLNSPGVYAIVHLSSGRRYIGASVNVLRRFQLHKYHLKNNVHGNRHLQRAWNKHGPLAFGFILIETVNDIVDLSEREQFHLDQSLPVVFNIGRTVDRPMLGVRHSEKTKAEQSRIARERPADKEALRRERLSRATMGRVISPEQRAKLSAALKGRVFSPQTLEKLAVASKKGAAVSRELWKTTEFREKMSQLQRMPRHPHSAETKAKMSVARKLYWQRRKETA